MKNLRHDHGIPPEGFGNNLEEYRKWYSNQKRKRMDELVQELERLFSNEYKITKFTAAYWYVTCGLFYQSVVSWLSLNESFEPIQILTSDVITSLKKSNLVSNSPIMPFATGLDDMFLIVINEPIKIGTIKEFLDKNWRTRIVNRSKKIVGIKEEMEAFFKRVSEDEDFRRNYIIYYFHQKSLKPIKIKGVLKKLLNVEINPKTIHKVIERLDERIKSIEKLATQK